MSKPIKLSDRDKRWVGRNAIAKRPRASRTYRQRILIVCEGTKTEPHYFESIRKSLPPNLVFIEIKGEGANTLSLVERARQIRDERKSGDYAFDQVWVVFDRDSFSLDAFDNAIQRAEADGMRCAWSNEAFELWYVLHFEYRDTGMPRSEYARWLGEHLNEPYSKIATDMYNKLSQLGNQKQAIAWAKRLHETSIAGNVPPSRSNPCTTMYLLVSELNQYLRPIIAL